MHDSCLSFQMSEQHLDTLALNKGKAKALEISYLSQ